MRAANGGCSWQPASVSWPCSAWTCTSAPRDPPAEAQIPSSCSACASGAHSEHSQCPRRAMQHPLHPAPVPPTGWALQRATLAWKLMAAALHAGAAGTQLATAATARGAPASWRRSAGAKPPARCTSCTAGTTTCSGPRCRPTWPPAGAAASSSLTTRRTGALPVTPGCISLHPILVFQASGHRSVP